MAQWEPRTRTPAESTFVVDPQWKTAVPERPDTPPEIREPLWKPLLRNLLTQPAISVGAVLTGGAVFFGFVPLWVGVVIGAIIGLLCGKLYGAVGGGLLALAASVLWWFVAGLCIWVWWDGRESEHNTRWLSLVEWGASVGFVSWLIWRIGVWGRCQSADAVCASSWYSTVWFIGALLMITATVNLISYGYGQRGADWHLKGQWQDWIIGIIVGGGIWCGWIWLASGWLTPGNPPTMRVTLALYGGVMLWWVGRKIINIRWTHARRQAGMYADEENSP